jgi:hypothetical protein
MPINEDGIYIPPTRAESELINQRIDERFGGSSKALIDTRSKVPIAPYSSVPGDGLAGIAYIRRKAVQGGPK